MIIVCVHLNDEGMFFLSSMRSLAILNTPLNLHAEPDGTRVLTSSALLRCLEPQEGVLQCANRGMCLI